MLVVVLLISAIACPAQGRRTVVGGFLGDVRFSLHPPSENDRNCRPSIGSFAFASEALRHNRAPTYEPAGPCAANATYAAGIEIVALVPEMRIGEVVHTVVDPLEYVPGHTERTLFSGESWQIWCESNESVRRGAERIGARYRIVRYESARYEADARVTFEPPYERRPRKRRDHVLPHVSACFARFGY